VYCFAADYGVISLERSRQRLIQVVLLDAPVGRDSVRILPKAKTID
jgi:hypothetical protein